MSKSQCKKTINKRKNKMSTTESNYPTTSKPKHSDTVEAQAKNLKNNFMKMI